MLEKIDFAVCEDSKKKWPKTTRPARVVHRSGSPVSCWDWPEAVTLYGNGLCKPPVSSGVRQVFRAERPKPQPPHVYYYYHQNFSYMLDRPPFPCKPRIFLANFKVNRRNRVAKRKSVRVKIDSSSPLATSAHMQA